jgi:hypothetical protein
VLTNDLVGRSFLFCNKVDLNTQTSESAFSFNGCSAGVGFVREFIVYIIHLACARVHGSLPRAEDEIALRRIGH